MSNVLLFSIFDNGNQLQHLAEALRKYTSHDALHLNVKQSYLDYDADVKLPEIITDEQVEELLFNVNECDFFIFSEVLPADVKKMLSEFGIYNKINPDNTIIRTAGSYRTLKPKKLLNAWVKENWMFAGPYADWYISGRIGRMAPVNYICPVDKIPIHAEPDDIIRVCFSPTRTEKGTAAFNRVMDKIISTHDNVEKVLIKGVSFKESIKLKSTCYITFDQFMLHHYANSSIESMYLGHAVLSDVRSWCRMIHPDLPIINIRNENELYSELIELIDNKELSSIGAEGRQYVITHHHPKVVAKQWNYLIEHVQSM